MTDALSPPPAWFPGIFPDEDLSLIDSLPLFTFGSVRGRNSSSEGDCAVCLSKFEPHDQLRLLPICCHAFHARCIDTWLASNQTCPLCRSPIFATEADFMKAILAGETIDDAGAQSNQLAPEPPGPSTAAEVASGRSWLKDYVDRLSSTASLSISSRALSFRSSGRFFTGSSRRNETASVGEWDLEANRVGEEISEMFRWFSGI
ncbi:unnamed protein product, partial [Vitis vinifera]|uniref:RING-type E3 ubiquitin transferase n=1 Tax=Vitis vinifera TaxID=29760 RepID=D7SM36_VITVI